MGRSLEDLIGKKKTIKIDGISQEVMFPRSGIYSFLGIRFPTYSPFPKFVRSDRGSIDSRIEKYYGKVEIVRNKVYKIRNE